MHKSKACTKGSTCRSGQKQGIEKSVRGTKQRRIKGQRQHDQSILTPSSKKKIWWVWIRQQTTEQRESLQERESIRERVRESIRERQSIRERESIREKKSIRERESIRESKHSREREHSREKEHSWEFQRESMRERERESHCGREHDNKVYTNQHDSSKSSLSKTKR
jgi:hypothetical protein